MLSNRKLSIAEVEKSSRTIYSRNERYFLEAERKDREIVVVSEELCERLPGST